MLKGRDFSLEKNSLLVFFLSITGSAINYLFQIISGRVMDTAQYGELNTLFSIFNIATVIGTSLGLSVAKVVAKTEKDIGFYTKKLCQHGILFLVIYCLALFCFLSIVMNFAKSTAILTSLAISLTSVSYVFYGVLQGKQDFKSVGVFNLFAPIFKITLGIFLIIVFVKQFNSEYSYNAVLISLVFSSLVCICYGQRKVHKISTYDNQHCGDMIKSTYDFLRFTLISSLCIVVFNNIDILIIRHFFDEEIVGLYSAVLVFGKIILYIPSALVVIMVPMVSKNNNNLQLLFKNLLYSVGLSSVAAVFLGVFSKTIISLIMGEKYLAATEYVNIICIMIVPLVASTVLINYLLANGSGFFVSLSCVVSVVTMVILTTVFNSTPQLILTVISTVYLLLFIVLLSKALIDIEKSKKRCN